MLESELHDRDSHDNAGSGRSAAELNPPAPSVPAAVFQAPQVVFQPPAVRSEPAPASQPSGSARSASQPSGSARPAGAPGNGEPSDEGGADDDGPQPDQER